jgi:hypothetical protein
MLSFENRPEINTPEWESWWKEYHAKAKIDHYYATYKREITWKETYIAPPQAKGCWLEIRMVQDEHDPVIYHETWDFNMKLSNAVTNRIMIDIRAILDILIEETPGFSTPYIIQIDAEGMCHLLSYCWRDKISTCDKILNMGTLEWVT